MAFCSSNFKPYTYGLELRPADLDKQRNWIRPPPVPSNPKGARSLSAITNHLFVCACPENCPVRQRASWERVDRLNIEFSIEDKGIKIFEYPTIRTGIEDTLEKHQYFQECYDQMTFNQQHCQSRKSANGHRGQRYWEMPGKGTPNREIFDKCCYYGPSKGGAVTVRFVRGPVSILVIAYLEDKAIQKEASTDESSPVRFEDSIPLYPQDVVLYSPMSFESSVVETDQSTPSGPLTGLECIFDAADSVVLDDNYLNEIFNVSHFASVDSFLDVNVDLFGF